MKHILKKQLLIFIILVILTSCWDQIELKELTLITGSGIDRTENDLIEVSAEVVVATELGDLSAGNLDVEKLTLVRKGSGKTLADAFSDLDRKIPRQVFWGLSSIFIISEKVANEGIGEHIDFIIRHSESKLREYIFVSKESPKEVLSLIPPLEGRSSEVIREMAKNHIGIPVTVKDLSQMLRGEAGAAIVPYLVKIPPDNEKDPLKTIAFINGSVIFKEDKMVKQIDHETTNGVMWVRNLMKDIYLTISLDEADGFITISIPDYNVNVLPEINKEIWKMKVELTAEGSIIQNTTKLNLKNPDFIDKISKAASKEIETQINKALKEVQNTKADVFGFADAFHQKYPKQWAKEKENWDEIFAAINVEYDININIARQGMSNPPAGIPEKEVKEE